VSRGRVAAVLLAVLLAPSAEAARSSGQPVALVTAERQDELLAVALPGGDVVRRVHLPADPENVIAMPGRAAVVVVSARAGAVTILDSRTLRVVRVFRGFAAPHLAAFDPDRPFAYVTDDGAGQVVVIRLDRPRIVARLFVGVGAHHLALDPSGSRLWVALGERARFVAIVDTAKIAHPRLVGHFEPGFTVHDLAFSPDGRRVWLTSDDVTSVHVVDARTRRLLFSVPVGPPPQHVAFNEAVPHQVWLTSGYGRVLDLVDATSGSILRTRRTAYGSFNFATAGGLVVTSSLLTGTVAEYTSSLEPFRIVRVASSARDVALTVW
jgi:DNA-binding beta-propeller fold protein YncE